MGRGGLKRAPGRSGGRGSGGPRRRRGSRLAEAGAGPGRGSGVTHWAPARLLAAASAAANEARVRAQEGPRPHPAQRTFGFLSPQTLGGARGRAGGREAEKEGGGGGGGDLGAASEGAGPCGTARATDGPAGVT